MRNRRAVVSVICAFISTISISFSGNVSTAATLMGKFRAEIDGIGIDAFLLVILLSAFYYKTWDEYKKDSSLISHIMAVVFSLCMLIGKSYSVNGNWDFIFGGKRQFLIALFAFCGFFVLFDIGITFLFARMRKIGIVENAPAKLWFRFMDCHFWGCAFIIVFLCWLPYLLAYLPGSAPQDGYNQLLKLPILKLGLHLDNSILFCIKMAQTLPSVV